MTILLNYLLALLAGILMPLAFAPVGIFPLAVLSPAILLWLWTKSAGPKQTFWLGLTYGIGMFGLGVSWIYISIHTFGNTPALIAVLLTALVVFYQALFPAVQGYLLTRFFPGRSLWVLLLAFPASWVLFEWIRGWMFTGFPWLLIGYSQIISPLKGFVPLVGEWGLAFLITFSSGLLVLMTTRSLIILVILWITGWGLSYIRWVQPVGKPRTVALMQGNIAQSLKWDPQHLQDSIDTYIRLTRHHWGTDIIVWPESAFPLLLQEVQPVIADLDNEAKTGKSSLVLGIPMRAKSSDSYYNGIIGVGQANGVYHKRRLVPFGEYVPLEKYLRGLIGFFDVPMSNFVSGFGERMHLMAGDLRLAPFICYEIAYSSILRQDLPDAKLLVTISNDSWFGDSLAPWQHLEIGRFRALQTGRDLLFATNDGVTAIVDNKGKIQKALPQFTEGVLTGTVQPREGSTPWVIWGNLPILLLMVVFLGMARIGMRKRIM